MEINKYLQYKYTGICIKKMPANFNGISIVMPLFSLSVIMLICYIFMLSCQICVLTYHICLLTWHLFIHEWLKIFMTKICRTFDKTFCWHVYIIFCEVDIISYKLTLPLRKSTEASFNLTYPKITSNFLEKQVDLSYIIMTNAFKWH